jgi:hypothetical protein
MAKHVGISQAERGADSCCAVSWVPALDDECPGSLVTDEHFRPDADDRFPRDDGVAEHLRLYRLAAPVGAGVRGERSDFGISDRNRCTSCSLSRRVRHADMAVCGRNRRKGTPVADGGRPPPRGLPTPPPRTRFRQPAQAGLGPIPPSRESSFPARPREVLPGSGKRGRRSAPALGSAPTPRLRSTPST